MTNDNQKLGAYSGDDLVNFERKKTQIFIFPTQAET